MTGRCAVVLLGLDPNTFDLAPNLLREEAAEIYGVSLERFRREPQKIVLSLVADRILEQCFFHRARLARLALEQRHPADTRLAVQWLERFEVYFRIWTPVYALGADLTAYRGTLVNPNRQWDNQDREGGGEAYSQEHQAGGYGTFALYHLACVLTAEQQFLARYGGLWLLSSPAAESEARDALHEVSVPTAMNERDRSWLRTALNEAGGETHGFLNKLQGGRLGLTTLEEWGDWLAECDCTWEAENHDAAIEYFPTGRYQPGITPDCPVHRSIEAASNFCSIIEQEWIKVADWYGMDSRERPRRRERQLEAQRTRVESDPA